MQHSIFTARRVAGLLLAALVLLAVGMSAWQTGLATVWHVLVLFFATLFGFQLARSAITRPRRQRDISALPKPSALVAQYVAQRAIVEALKAYRREAGATLREAQAVLAHYWPAATSRTSR